jgi:hypothetical protein
MFDPEAIEAFRRHVEARTAAVTATYAALGLLLGLATAALLGRGGPPNWPLSCGTALAGAVIGYVIGCERAFMLRLQAQMTLFQAHIEANTQPVTAFDAAPTRVNPPCRSLLVKAGLRMS